MRQVGPAAAAHAGWPTNASARSKARSSAAQVIRLWERGWGPPLSDSEYSSPREANNPIWRTVSAVMAPGEHLCKLNWGNSVSPTENQLPYGFKIKHTHTIKAWGRGGQLGRNRTQTQLLLLDLVGAGQPSHTCTSEETKIYFVVPEADSPNGSEINAAPGFGHSPPP